MGLALDTWRDLFGFDPCHFWGLAGPKAPVTSDCLTVVYEHTWQNGQAVGRADIRTAIAEAERKLGQALGYPLTPVYREVTLPWATAADSRLPRTSPANGQGRYRAVDLPDGMLLALGTEVLTPITTAAVAYTDIDGDGIPDTAVISATLSEALPAGAEIVCYHSAAQRYDGSGIGARWEIAPVRATVSGLTIQLTCPAQVLVRPVLYARRRPQLPDLDASDLSVYASTVDLVSRTTDAAATGSVSWEQSPWPEGIDCAAGPGTQTFSAVEVRNAAQGRVAPIFPWTGCGWWPGRWREPDTITIRYRAGLALVEGDMDPRWTLAAARLAAAELAAPICACEAANRSLAEWQFDLSRAAGKMDEQFQLSQRHLDCPWGTRRGHVYAWEQAAELYLARGTAL